MNKQKSTFNTLPKIVGLSALICIDKKIECYDVGLVSSSGKVVGPPKSRLAGIIGSDNSSESIPSSWISLHRRANPVAQEVQ